MKPNDSAVSSVDSWCSQGHKTQWHLKWWARWAHLWWSIETCFTSARALCRKDTLIGAKSANLLSAVETEPQTWPWLPSWEALATDCHQVPRSSPQDVVVLEAHAASYRNLLVPSVLSGWTWTPCVRSAIRDWVAPAEGPRRTK
jgi:hypothetical protein